MLACYRVMAKGRGCGGEKTLSELLRAHVAPQEVAPQEVTPQEVTPQEVTPFDSSLTLIREPTEGIKGATWNNTERLALSGGKDLSRSWS